MSTTQRALQSGPGRFRGLLAFDLLETEGPATRHQALLRAATLLHELESEDLNDKPLKILVGVAPRLLESHDAWPDLSLEYTLIGNFHHAQPAVVVQIAAETEDDRTYALRLVRRIFKGVLSLREECYGGRHFMNKEPFGYSEAFWEDTTDPPESAHVPGVSWLLYQRCTQNLSRFFSASDEKRDQVLGRTPDASPDSAPSAGSHVDHARRATHENGRSLLQRRSFGYETYSDAGVVFLASAARPETLKRALQSMDHDPLKTFIRLETGGIYVVPPNSRWLAPTVELEKLDGDRRPPAERAFYPKSPLLLYEMTPKAREFFYRVFHANNTNFDDDAGSLREDLQVTAKGLAKMLYGARLSPTSTFFRLLARAFTWNNSEPFLNEAVNREIEALRRDKANGATVASLSERRLKIRKALTSTAQLERAAGDLAAISALDLFADLICDDAEFLAGSDPAKQADYDTLIELCVEAAKEARAVNTKAGGYMTLVC